MSILHLVAVTINVLIATGDYGLSLEEWKNVRQGTQEIFKREYPRGNIKLSFVSPILTTSSEAYTLADSTQAYYYWNDRLKAEKKKGVWLVVLPPTTDRFITGYTRTTCFKDINLSTSVVFLQSQNDRGEDRRLHSSYAVAHELAHVMDSTHIDSMTIMHPNPLPWITQYGMLPFDIKSKREIRRCVG